MLTVMANKNSLLKVISYYRSDNGGWFSWDNKFSVGNFKPVAGEYVVSFGASSSEDRTIAFVIEMAAQLKMVQG